MTAEEQGGLRPDTVAVRAGRARSDGALAPTIVTTTTWASDSVDEAHRKARRSSTPASATPACRRSPMRSRSSRVLTPGCASPPGWGR